MKKDKISTLYRLSPMQEGMLFHGIYGADSLAYMEQLIADFPEGLDIPAFKASWESLLRNHTSLRSGFFHDELSVMVQCVYKVVELPFQELDYRGHTPQAQETMVEEFLQMSRSTPFDFKEPPLMRITLIRLGESHYRMVWVFHHILMDGWSMPVLFEELLSSYGHYTRGSVPPPRREDRYEDFIKYLQTVDKFKEEQFWRGYLAGFDTPTLLPFAGRQVERNHGTSLVQEISLALAPAESAALQAFAQRHGLTLNSVCQGAWAYLLSLYSGSADVVFGVTVSGRPADLPDAERSVGLYINTVPLRATVTPEGLLTDWLQGLQRTHTAAREHQHVALTAIKKWQGVQGDLFDSLFVFENYPIGELVQRQWALKVGGLSTREQTNLPLTIVAGMGDVLRVRFGYNPDLMDATVVQMIRDQFGAVLRAFVASGNRPLGELELLSAADRAALLAHCDRTAVAYPAQLNLVQRFAQMVRLHPERVAVACDGDTLTYAALDARADALARRLVARGVQQDALVALCLERTLDMPVAMLAVLKAGAAYVPIDPDYPASRIEFMLADSGTRLLITHPQVVRSFALPEAVQVVDMAQAEPATAALPLPDDAFSPSALAYVIYTSGSTGLPKGALITHENVIRLFFNDQPLFDFGPTDVWTQFHSYCFDFSVWEMYGALLYGGSVHIVPKAVARDTAAFAELLVRAGVTVLNQTPAAFYALQEEMLASQSAHSLRYVIFGGEALLPSRLSAWHRQYPACSLINMYGITETTVHVTYQRIGEAEIAQGASVIGGPIPTLACYVLDAAQRLLPQGAAGELYVGGAGLARAYLNRPELTEARFLPNHLTGHGRLYRTGDLARWLPDGTLEYLGRIDDQVKIRGYRIETGEIESVLERSGHVRQCVVLAHKEASGTQSLVAYVVPEGPFDRDAIRKAAGQSLPDYMVPPRIIEIDRVPLTSNGKVDRKALPHPESAALVTTAFAVSRNQAEQDLCDIWKELLKLEAVGIEDNFFELGGDSIVSIQVVARAKRKGYALKPRDLFLNPTVAGLAAVIQAASAEGAGEQGSLRGEADLLPIQHWFFERATAHRSHFNQALLLQVPKGLASEALATAWAAVGAKHDALGFAYAQADGKWTQTYGGFKGRLQTVDLRHHDGDLSAEITREAESQQRSLDIASGELTRLVRFQLPAAQPQDRLLIVIHHLAVDGVSWRILLSDLEVALAQAEQGEPISLGTKTSSYRQWVQALQQHIARPAMATEAQYWQAMAERYAPLPSPAQPSAARMVSHQVSLDLAQTQALLHGVHHAYRTEINDLLLTALVQAMHSWTGERSLVLGLEGHGREAMDGQMDVSETVGWFTTLYPVALAIDPAAGLGEQVVAIKEQLRAVPMKGLGFGALRYLHPSERVRAALAAVRWDVGFNYLGQFDNVLEAGRRFQAAPESPGRSVAEDFAAAHALDVSGFVAQGLLQFAWRFDAARLAPEAVAAVADRFIGQLQAIIAHAQAQTFSLPSPSDYGLAGAVDARELQEFLLAEENGEQRLAHISDLYRLSPTQEGMLFHALYDPASAAYVMQLVVDFPEGLDLDAFQGAWNHLLRQHTILRTGFYAEGLGIPVQCVFRHAELPVACVDLSGLNGAGQRDRLAELLEQDRTRGFDFTAPPLMRVTLYALGNGVYQMAWTSHHILFDGWSKPILVAELMAAYAALRRGETPESHLEDAYGDFIRHLDGRDAAGEADFWKAYLQGLEEPTLLPFVPESADRNKGAGEVQESDLILDQAFAQRLQEFAKTHQLTVNAIMQGVWAYVLSQYAGRADVVYGITVSGRPTELRGAERGVGLYINSLPLRVQVHAGQPILPWLKALQAEQSQVREHQHTALNRIQRWAGLPGDLFDSILVFENYPIGEAVDRSEALPARVAQVREQSNYLLTVTASLGAGFRVNFNYNSRLLAPAYVEAMKGHVAQVLQAFLQAPLQPLGAVDLLSAAERASLLGSPASLLAPELPMVTDIIAARAAARPEATALVTRSGSLSFQALDRRANALAHHLRTALGVGPEQVVAILCDRSERQLIALLAVLKAGGAYLPLDPGNPGLRNLAILQDAKASVLLLDSAQLFEVEGFEGELFALDLQLDGLEMMDLPPAPRHAPENLAYVIYTSGSTGRPKGVMVEHRQLSRYLADSAGLVQPAATSGAGSYIHMATSFDASITALFLPLMAGRPVVLSEAKPLEVFADPLLLAHAPYDFIKLTPSHLQLLAADVAAPALAGLCATYVLGGEALHAHQLQFLVDAGSQAHVLNEYGPTESTVGCVTYGFRLGAATASGPQGLHIGRALPHVQALVLGPDGKLLPVGVPGELCLAGAQLARGYLGRPDLTAERFIPHPLDAQVGARLYRTGDRARWTLDGQLEFLGRMDHQVKVNGYRIELGEVEHAIRESGLVQETAVVVQQADGRARLTAYVVPPQGGSVDGLLPWLRARLPEYMLPTQVVPLAAMPLTPHGKLDLRALPAVAAPAHVRAAQVAPRNAIEADLAAIWADLLKGSDFSVHDNFFEQGGDSIISIQVVSRARRKGYHLNPYDVFQYPTIATLAAAIAAQSAAPEAADEEPTTGPVGLLPVQHWFLDKAYAQRSHFNQALLLELDKRHTEAQLSAALDAVVQRHEVLQHRFVQNGDSWQQLPGGPPPALSTVDLRDVPMAELPAAIAVACETAQRSLDLAQGRLSQMVLLHTPQAEPRNRFLWVIHHLAVDGVSWRVLMDQLQVALSAVVAGQPVVLGARTARVAQFQADLSQAALRPRLLAELPHWEGVAAGYKPLPVDHAGGHSTVADLSTISLRLGAPETAALLSGVHFAYNTQINDLLLAALLMALQDWTGEEAVVVGLEGHGRETAGLGDRDLSETVGWFTNIYPVALRASRGADPGELVQQVKESLRGVPGRGMGHGILRYLHPDAQVRETVARCKWDILFNYLGQIGNSVHASGDFQMASEDLGRTVADDYPVDERLVINCSVVRDELVMAFRYSRRDYAAETLQHLAAGYLQSLQALIAHCAAQPERNTTPSDHGLGGDLTPQEFLRFMNVAEAGGKRKDLLQAVCRLSPVQEGMLFHALYDPDSEAYIVQLIADFKEEIDQAAFLAAWRYVIQNHSVFRTAFFHAEMSMPVQAIYKTVEMPYTFLDWAGESADVQQRLLAETLRQDHETKFEFHAAPLMRMTLIRLGARDYKMVWTSHHILADGWSKPVLFKEVLGAYDAYLGGGAPPVRTEDRYEDFIHYLSARDQAEELAFWRDYFRGFETPSLLPFNALTYGRNSGTGTSRELDLDLDAETTQRLEAVAKQYQVTVNSLFQSIWFLLLSHYTGSKDVMCGVTVSGRPPEMEEVEDRIGLYIHTLPIRADLSTEQPLANWIREVHASHTLSREYQYTPLSAIQKALGIQGDLFDSVLVFENYPRKSVNERKLKAEGSRTVEHTNYMLTLLALIGPEMTIRFSYNSSILPTWAVEMIRGHYLHVLTQILDRPEGMTSDVQVLTPQERQQMIVDFNTIPKEFEIDQTVVDLFEEQVRLHPGNIAVQFQGEQLTYRELNARANRLARYLVAYCGVAVGDMVPLLTLRGVDMIVGMMAVFKAGGAYVPLDAEYPIDRIADVLKHTRARTVLTTSDYVDLCDTLQWELDTVAHVVRIDSGQLPDFDLLEGASKGLWDHVADRATNAVEASGWASSYTGEFFSDQEIADLVGNVVTKLAPHLAPHKRLLEVGCGSGLLINAFRERVAHVTGTDISHSVLAQLRRDLAAAGVENVDLHTLTARQLGKLPAGKYDIIVVNSVVQYFPNFRYLREFLAQAEQLLNPGGVLFLGDLRDKELQMAYYQSLFEGQADAGFRVDEKRRGEVELFVRKDFLEDYFGQLGRANQLSMSRKIGVVANELVRFRFDAMIAFDGEAAAPAAPHKLRHLDWDGPTLSSENLELRLRFTDPSYLIFTSGSTGRPKGVAIPHSALSNFLLSMRIAPGMTHTDSLLSVSTYTFDISVLDFLLPLATGAKLILTPLETVVQPEKIIEILATERPTVMQAVPTYWRVLIEHGWRGDADIKVLSGGEAISSYLVEELIARSREYWNCYGPTETTIYCSHRKTVSLEEGINVGQPMHNTTYYVLDPARNMVAVGVPGEVYIGGELLAIGYYDDEALTRKVFIDNPHRPGERIYKSGDLGRWRPDGKLEILGRVDTQLKIRGFRIEAEEVEMVLLRHPDIAVAVVTAWEKDGQKNLVAYIIPEEGAQLPDVSAMRNLLADALPHYMIPAYFVEIDALPQTARGKINRRALPDPTSHRMGGGASFEGPRTKAEEKLVEIWQSLLNLERVGIRDNFFLLGGHSLLAVRLMARINKAFERELPISVLFDHPTIAELAPQLSLHAIQDGNKVLVPLNKGGALPMLFCAPGAGGNVMSYYALGKLLEGTRALYGFQAVGVDGKQRPLESVEEIAALNIAEMQAVDPVGPYALAGYSFGGKVVYEMALQLRRSGFQVSELYIFDMGSPTLALLDPSERRLGTFEESLAEVAGIWAILYGKDLRMQPQEFEGLSRGDQYAKMLAALEGAGIDLSLNQLTGFTNVYLANYSCNYIPQDEEKFAFPIHLYKTTETQAAQEKVPGRTVPDDLWWESVTTGPVAVTLIDCNHLSILNAPAVGLIFNHMETQKIRTYLQ